MSMVLEEAFVSDSARMVCCLFSSRCEGEIDIRKLRCPQPLACVGDGDGDGNDGDGDDVRPDRVTNKRIWHEEDYIVWIVRVVGQ
jgi:hypothetical protein